VETAAIISCCAELQSRNYHTLYLICRYSRVDCIAWIVPSQRASGIKSAIKPNHIFSLSTTQNFYEGSEVDQS
jgi:hypothetical protein